MEKESSESCKGCLWGVEGPLEGPVGLGCFSSFFPSIFPPALSSPFS